MAGGGGEGIGARALRRVNLPAWAAAVGVLGVVRRRKNPRKDPDKDTCPRHGPSPAAPPAVPPRRAPQWTWWQGRSDNEVRIEEQVRLREQYGFRGGGKDE